MSPYFDGCYFDPDYFDASECTPPVVTGGRQAYRSRRTAQLTMPEPLIRNDDEEAILVLEGL